MVEIPGPILLKALRERGVTLAALRRAIEVRRRAIADDPEERAKRIAGLVETVGAVRKADLEWLTDLSHGTFVRTIDALTGKRTSSVPARLQVHDCEDRTLVIPWLLADDGTVEMRRKSSKWLVPIGAAAPTPEQQRTATATMHLVLAYLRTLLVEAGTPLPPLLATLPPPLDLVAHLWKPPRPRTPRDPVVLETPTTPVPAPTPALPPAPPPAAPPIPTPRLAPPITPTAASPTPPPPPQPQSAAPRSTLPAPAVSVPPKPAAPPTPRAAVVQLTPAAWLPTAPPADTNTPNQGSHWEELEREIAKDAARRRARWRRIGTVFMVVILLVAGGQRLIRVSADAPPTPPPASIPTDTTAPAVDVAIPTPLVAAPTPEPTLVPLRYGTVVVAAGARANLRATPSTDGAVVAKLDAGTELILIEQSGDWWRVQAPVAGQGWVLATLIAEHPETPVR